MNGGKLISVVVPVYNVERYLDRCVESIVRQDYQDLEIILVDDGSPDNCPALCDKWAEKDPRIKVIHKENGGLSDARNKGMAAATGYYLTFVDSDDFIDKAMYSSMTEAMERTGADIAACGMYKVGPGQTQEVFTDKNEFILSPADGIAELLRRGRIVEAAWGKLYVRSLFQGIEFPVGEINEDIPVMPYLFTRANRIVCTGKPYYYYCENPGSITRSGYGDKQRVIIKHVRDVSEYVTQRFPELEDAVREFKGRYGLNNYILFLKDPALQGKYPDDFIAYRELLRRNITVLLKSKCIGSKKKAESVCALLGVYMPARRIMNLFRPE